MHDRICEYSDRCPDYPGENCRKIQRNRIKRCHRYRVFIGLESNQIDDLQRLYRNNTLPPEQQMLRQILGKK